MKDSLILVNSIIKENTKKGILEALTSISIRDADFIGDNGPKYLWSSAKEKGFASNQKYLIDLVSKFDNTEDMVNKFMKYWLGYDGYYKSYTYQIIRNENNVPIAISLAYVC